MTLPSSLCPVYVKNLAGIFLFRIRQKNKNTERLHWSICCVPISPVTTQRQSIAVRQSRFQGHIIAVLDTAPGLF